MIQPFSLSNFSTVVILTFALLEIVHSGKKVSVYAFDHHNFRVWGATSPLCTSGDLQSPINLERSVAHPGNGNLGPAVVFLNYNIRPKYISLENDGHTVYLTVTWDREVPTITGAALGNHKYSFFNAHVHWSTDDNNGTEHSFYKKKYAAEVHLVHLNIKYRTIKEASNKEDGLAIIGIPFKVDNSKIPNPGLSLFSIFAKSQIYKGSSNEYSDFPISLFISDLPGSYYAYTGSITFPPCTENVRWLVVPEPQPVASDIMETLRKIELGKDDHNIRPIQETNDRVIVYYNNS